MMIDIMAKIFGIAISLMIVSALILFVALFLSRWFDTMSFVEIVLILFACLWGISFITGLILVIIIMRG